MIARMERMSLQTRMVSVEMDIMEGNARYLSGRVQNLKDDCNRNEASYEIMRDELTAIKMYNEAQEGRIANLEYRIQNDEHQIGYAESRARIAEEKADTVDQQLIDLMKVLARILGGNQKNRMVEFHFSENYTSCAMPFTKNSSYEHQRQLLTLSNQTFSDINLQD
ncbi:hypothetical protein LXL04_007792 [Taraxacum kok-saghyz]